MCNAPCYMVDTNDIMWHMYAYTSAVYAHKKFGIYGISAQFSGNTSFWHIFDNSFWSSAVDCVVAHLCKNVKSI